MRAGRSASRSASPSRVSVRQGVLAGPGPHRDRGHAVVVDRETGERDHGVLRAQHAVRSRQLDLDAGELVGLRRHHVSRHVDRVDAVVAFEAIAVEVALLELERRRVRAVRRGSLQRLRSALLEDELELGQLPHVRREVQREPRPFGRGDVRVGHRARLEPGVGGVV